MEEQQTCHVHSHEVKSYACRGPEGWLYDRYLGISLAEMRQNCTIRLRLVAHLDCLAGGAVPFAHRLVLKSILECCLQGDTYRA